MLNALYIVTINILTIGTLIGAGFVCRWLSGTWWPAVKIGLDRSGITGLVKRLGARITKCNSTLPKGDADVERAYVAVLISASKHGGSVSEKRQQTIARIAKRIEQASKLDLRLAQLLADPELGHGSVGGCGRFAAAMLQRRPFLQAILAQDVCAVLFCDGSPSEIDLDWLKQFSQIANWGEVAVPIIRFFERPVAPERQKWLDELGLSAEDNADAIHHAYRQKAMQYHPDRCSHMPPHIRQLTEAKMAAVNDAYAKLTDQTLTLFFRNPDAAGSMTISASSEWVVCMCWICQEKNRVIRSAENAVARCGNCHALLGVYFDPFC